MPAYIFENPETGETIEVVQKMNDFHIYIDYDGLEWDRVFTSPNANVSDNLIGANTTEAEFVKKTSEKNYTLGEMWDLSAQLSEKRAKTDGKDPIKEKAKKVYERKTGKKHPNARKRGGTTTSI